jgi:hypothetical protein
MGATSRQLIAEHILDRTLETFAALDHRTINDRRVRSAARPRTASA